MHGISNVFLEIFFRNFLEISFVPSQTRCSGLVRKVQRGVLFYFMRTGIYTFVQVYTRYES